MNKIVMNQLNQLAEKYNLDVLVLFGSRAKKTHNQKSDYDLAFYKKNISCEQEYNLFNEIMNILRTEKIDLINIGKNTDTTLRNEIFKSGMCIYEKEKSLFNEMQGDALLDYLDFKELGINRTEIIKQRIMEL